MYHWLINLTTDGNLWHGIAVAGAFVAIAWVAWKLYYRAVMRWTGGDKKKKYRLVSTRTVHRKSPKPIIRA